MRPRLLPATIGLTGLLLATKCMGLISAALPNGWTIHQAVLPVAVAASAAETDHPVSPPQPPHVPVVAALPASLPKPSDPPAPVVSEAERQLLQDLRTRRQMWDARDRALTEREAVLGAAEQRLVAQASELASLQARLELLEKARADRDDANWAGLVKVYETMKPREAAAIFNDMDMPVLLQIVDRMKEVKAALIFGAMQPDRARLVTAQLAAKRSRTTAMDHADTPAEGAPHS